MSASLSAFDRVVRRLVATKALDRGRLIRPCDWTTAMDHFARRMAAMEELDETARVWLQCQPQPLAESAIDQLQNIFGASW